MIRNVILDWSGTVIDDLPAVWRSTNEVLGKAGAPELSLDQFRAEFRLPFREFYDRYTSHVSPDQLETWFHEAFRRHDDLIKPLPFALEFLTFCRQQGIQLMVLSTMQEHHFRAQLERFDLNGFFSRCFLGVTDKRSRIHSIINELNLVCDETLFVGDMQHDIDTAKHGGVRSCAVLTGYNFLHQLRESAPDLIVSDLGELIEQLKRGQFANRSSPTHSHQHLRRPIATVGALIFNDEGQVLLVRTAKWSSLWGIPGGKIEFGETAVDALKREIREETGLELTTVEMVMVQDCISNPEFYRDEHFILINYKALCRDSALVRLNHEAQTYQWIDPNKVRSLPLNQPTIALLNEVCPIK